MRSKPNLIATLIVLSNKVFVILTSAKLNVEDEEEDRNEDEWKEEEGSIHAQG